MAYDKATLLQLVAEHMDPEEQPQMEDLIEKGLLSVAASGLLAIFDYEWTNKKISDERYAELCERLGMPPEERAQLRSRSKSVHEFGKR